MSSEDEGPADNPAVGDEGKRVGGSTGCQLVLLVACVAVVIGCLLGLSVTGARLITPPGWERTTATLAGSDRTRVPGTTDYEYDRRYTFTATDGHTYRVVSERSTQGRVGSTVSVTYNPDNPDEAYLGGFVETIKRLGWSVLLVVIAVGALLLGLALVVDNVKRAVRSIRQRVGPGDEGPG